jgi:hypothetical protein
MILLKSNIFASEIVQHDVQQTALKASIYQYFKIDFQAKRPAAPAGLQVNILLF